MATESGLVGREAELRLFGAWIDDVVSGAGRAVLVEGEPGIGKSSLVRAVVNMAKQRGLSTYWAECDEVGQALPLVTGQVVV